MKNAFGNEVLGSLVIIANKVEKKWDEKDDGGKVKTTREWLNNNGYGHIPMEVVDVVEDPGAPQKILQASGRVR